MRRRDRGLDGKRGRGHRYTTGPRSADHEARHAHATRHDVLSVSERSAEKGRSHRGRLPVYLCLTAAWFLVATSAFLGACDSGDMAGDVERPRPTSLPGFPTTNLPGLPTENRPEFPTTPLHPTESEVPHEPSSSTFEPPSRTESPSAPLDPSTRQQKLDQLKKQLRDGTIAYRAPEPMRVNDFQRVTVRVRDESSESTTAPELPGTGPMTSDPVKVGPDVKAELTGRDFEIGPVGDDDGRRVLVTGGYVDWAWDVRPLRSGRLQLSVTLSVLLEDASAPPLEVRTYDRVVNVDVDPWFSFKRFLKEWGALTGIGVPAVVIGIWTLYKHWRQRGEPSATTSEFSRRPTSHRPSNRRRRASRDARRP